MSDVLGAEDPDLEHPLDMEAVRPMGRAPPAGAGAADARFYGNMTQDQIGQRMDISQMHRLPAARPCAVLPARAHHRSSPGSAGTAPAPTLA